jgi:hypothetical protein
MAVAPNFSRTLEGAGMTLQFRITSQLLAQVKADLSRRHAYARERVGFIVASAAELAASGLGVLARSYLPVADEHYINQPKVGALMSGDALRDAMQFAYRAKCSIFHVHMHEHQGWPWFSRYDLSENSKFVPDFFNVSTIGPHGALVLSHNSAAGIVWTTKASNPASFDEIIEVGAPLRVHRRQR